MKNRKKHLVFIVGIILFVIFFIITNNASSDKASEPTEISYTEFLQKIDSNAISSITMKQSSTKVEASYTNAETEETIYYIVEIPNQEAFVNYVQERISSENEGPKLNIIDDTSDGSFFEVISGLFSLAYILIIFFILRGFYKRIKNANSNNGNTPSFMNPFNTDINYIDKMVKSNVKFSDVAGMNEEKEELIEIVDFLKNPSKYTAIGAKIPKGVLLSGEPGTGKTLLAKAVAGEAGVSFLAISGSEFIEKYVGVGASRIRGLFKEARKQAPCIVFIDEIDAVGAKREDGNNSEHNQTIEQLLTELDGFEGRTDIIVLAATNRLSSLDPALTRPGRFDRKIVVHLPDVKEREEILKLHAKGKNISPDIDFKSIAHNTAGYSGAELANLLNEAALIAARNNEIFIQEENIYEALAKITVGLKRSGKVVSEKERKLTAVHESGHAVAALLTETQANIKEVSIIPRGTAGGYTWHNTVEDKMYMSKKELEERLIVLLAGRAAEKLELSDISSGTSNDLEVATRIANQMITVYGMDDEIGPISLNGFSHSETALFGEKNLSNIGARISKLLREAEDKATKLLKENRAYLVAVAQKLLEDETISGEQLNAIFEEVKSSEDDDY